MEDKQQQPREISDGEIHKTVAQTDKPVWVWKTNLSRARIGEEIIIILPPQRLPLRTKVVKVGLLMFAIQKHSEEAQS